MLPRACSWVVQSREVHIPAGVTDAFAAPPEDEAGFAAGSSSFLVNREKRDGCGGATSGGLGRVWLGWLGWLGWFFWGFSPAANPPANRVNSEDDGLLSTLEFGEES